MHCSFPQTLLIWGLQRTLLFLPSGELEGCSSSLQTKPPRCFKNHKWALNDFNLPARAQSERGENNQHQFCQLSSLCLLSCSQLTQIQLLSKLNERPHNCLVNTFFFFLPAGVSSYILEMYWRTGLHPWALRWGATSTKLIISCQKMFSQIPFMKTTSQRPALSSLG